MSNAKHNAKMIVRCTTAYPFKLPERFMVCVYCCDSFDDPPRFRHHMSEYHPEVKLRIAFAHIPEGYIKIDCTDLRCRICFAQLNKLEVAVDHLIKEHDQTIDLSCDLGVQPFILPDEKWACALCESKFISLRALSRHTQSHFPKFTCEACGKSYFSVSSLRFHKQVSHIGDQRICVKCKKTFETLEEKRKHVLESPRCWAFVCKFCGERFVSSTLRNAHRTQVHGMQSKEYVCPECPEVFPDRQKYRIHFITTHTNDYFSCTCGKKFDSKSNLKKHMVVHTKEKLFPCTVCSKAFSRKKNLVQHMWIHSEHKRFECVDCNKQFNQKVTWKSHMKSYHPGVAIN
ncbi:hypothetical protein ABMA28_013060 [Loxostege sticticalis]|uniref:C2H2-type domain-containing protein n=1 Tax=Loxostege sticticalis TaxID=481309 RepID=A0ABD0S408_LOXSC